MTQGTIGRCWAETAGGGTFLRAPDEPGGEATPSQDLLDQRGGFVRFPLASLGPQASEAFLVAGRARSVRQDLEIQQS
jgi:hypothetical protein